jgi:hypothetical protein
VDTINIDASLYYPNDSLNWFTSSGSSENPANLSLPGIYTLQIRDRDNFCASTDTFHVHENRNNPIITGLSNYYTLTCLDDSLSLFANVSGAIPFCYWINESQEHIQNPFWCISSGQYLVHAVDSLNGCVSQHGIIVTENKSEPHLKVLYENTRLSCSDTLLNLRASSLMQNVSFIWQNLSGVFNSDSMWASDSGWCFVTALDTLNGCKRIDSVYITYEPTLRIQGIKDTLVCQGSLVEIPFCAVAAQAPFSLSINQIPFLFQERDSSLLIQADSNFTGEVMFSDSRGCLAIDTIFIEVSNSPEDSFLVYKSCDSTIHSGELQIYAYGGVPPYAYSIDNILWGSSSIFDSLPFGSHLYYIKDNLGCLKEREINLDQSASLPIPKSLISTNQFLQDTFVLIDLSQPVPDSCNFVLPSGVVLESENPPYYYFTHTDTGIVEFVMVLNYPGCEMTISKMVLIGEIDSLRFVSETMSGIESCSLFPNPANSIINVEANLNWKQNCIFQIFDSFGLPEFVSESKFGENLFWQADVHDLEEGIYFLKVISDSDIKTELLIIQR